MMSDCIFCQIANKSKNDLLINENTDFIAILDINPYVTGHALAIPKKHYRWVNDVENYSQYWEFVRDTAQKIIRTLRCDFISYYTVGTDVEHAHIHLIPRYFGDKLELVPGLPKPNSSPSQLMELCARINHDH